MRKKKAPRLKRAVGEIYAAFRGFSIWSDGADGWDDDAAEEEGGRESK